jgi:hypothetical protein
MKLQEIKKIANDTGVHAERGYHLKNFANQIVELDRQQRTWVGLADQEIEDAIYDGFAFGLDNGNVSNQTVIRHVIRVIQAKLKEKNG